MVKYSKNKEHNKRSEIYVIYKAACTSSLIRTYRQTDGRTRVVSCETDSHKNGMTLIFKLTTCSLKYFNIKKDQVIDATLDYIFFEILNLGIKPWAHRTFFDACIQFILVFFFLFFCFDRFFITIIHKMKEKEEPQ